MFRTEDHGVAAVEREADALVVAFPFDAQVDCPEGRRFDVDVELFNRRDEHMAAIRFAA